MNWLKPLRSLLVAENCYACDRPLVSQEQYVCLRCLSQLQATDFHQSPTKNELYFRLAGRVKIAGAASMFYFDKGGTLQTLIKALKYEDAPQIGNYLGQYAGEMMKSGPFLDGIEAVVPVPLHRRKQRKRGYNQAEKIAEGIAGVTDIPTRSDLLTRPHHTDTQARKAGSARWENVQSAFAVSGELPGSILLVDDVITTGATLEACIRAIHHANPDTQISIMSIGMARS